MWESHPPVGHSACFSRLPTSRTPISPMPLSRSISVVNRALAMTWPAKARPGAIQHRADGDSGQAFPGGQVGQPLVPGQVHGRRGGLR